MTKPTTQRAAPNRAREASPRSGRFPISHENTAVAPGTLNTRTSEPVPAHQPEYVEEFELICA
jgi:hypothetical protein